MSDWYDVTGNPAQRSLARSLNMRVEFELVQAAFGKLPALSGNANCFWVTNSSADGVTSLTASQARTALGLVIGTNVQAYSAVLQGTTASFTTAMETKLGYITITGPANFDTVASQLATISGSVSTCVSSASSASSSASDAGTSASTAGTQATAATTAKNQAVTAQETAEEARDESQAILDEMLELVAEIENVTTADPTVAVVISGGKYTIDASLGRRFEVTVSASGDMEFTNMTVAAATSAGIVVVTRNLGSFDITDFTSLDGHALRTDGTSLSLTSSGVDKFFALLMGASNNEIFIKKDDNPWVLL